METKVTVETFKQNKPGKYYQCITFMTWTPCSCIDKIKEEVIKVCNTTGFNYTIEVEQGNIWNKWLVINTK